ncbi:MAG: hypothetical protein DDT25_01082 [Chloroflexi bacterium]|nr:hypothetical protein [Chloroflexota bacterium]
MENGLRSANLFQLPGVHYTNSISHKERLFLVMGDKDDGRSGTGQYALDLGPYPSPQVCIQIGEGLIQQDNLRPGSQGARQGDPLLLSAGEFVGVPLCNVR